MFFLKSDIKTQKTTAGMLATEVRAGDAPKPQFSMKTNQKSTKIRKSTQIPNWGRAGFIIRSVRVPLKVG
jgi:hypothetical protein